MTKVEQLADLVVQLAQGTPRFFERLGAGAGDLSTRDFMHALREVALERFEEDFAERSISGSTALRVDY